MRCVLFVALALLSSCAYAASIKRDAAQLSRVASRAFDEKDLTSFSAVERVRLIEKYLAAFRAPIINSKKIKRRANSTPRRPVVLMHGLGDAGSNPGMQSLAKSVTAAYPGTYAVAVDVADGLDSFFTLMPDQVDQFAAKVRSDPNLAQGFNVLGLSQGGLVIRGYIERYNNPPVYNAISICGPQNGVGTCPAGTPGFICDIFKLGPYTAKLSFAGYWKEVADEATYLKDSTFLADVNNEREQKNASYVLNMTALNKYVLVMALNDTVVEPKESEQHGFWAWGDQTHSKIETIFQTQAYQENWLGLQTLNNTGRLDLLSFEGEHIRFSQQFWDQTILPYFDNAPDSEEEHA